MISKVVALIATVKQTQRAIMLTKCTLVAALAYQIMLIAFQASIKGNRMLSNVLIACLNKAVKLTLVHQVLNNHHKQWEWQMIQAINII